MNDTSEPQIYKFSINLQVLFHIVLLCLHIMHERLEDLRQEKKCSRSENGARVCCRK
ncbi:hypothetical protein POPTR_002G138100v4 [Populus trichocarpa]|uniref:Uncharacterized protein n=1 Tax=Populus trichocarpa TaxID=3694 RepID=A0A2K2BIJ4_POPTR|nr:hypothetical protein POPTR_002G138100v4 [Populus trichocarpa]